MPVSKRVSFLMTRSSWIRRMFEEGEKMRADGKGPVYDFSIGNPMLEPPGIFSQTLRDLAASPPPGLHRYMPNVGYQSTRKAVAEYVTGEYKVPVTADHVIMTVGAAGGCNVALKALLEPGDEVILLLPFFCEYEFYIDNHSGVMVLVPTQKNFDLDLDAIERALTPKTRVIIINTPNNPSGAVYSYESLNRLADLVRRKGAERGSPIYLISDEAYRKIIYEQDHCPSVLEVYENSIMVTSHSKDLGLPGERVGWLVMNPKLTDGAAIYNAMAFLNRTLGYINCPSIMQKAIEPCLRASIDVNWYRRKRDLLLKNLKSFGYDVVSPGGSFYMFPSAPGGDDLAFCRAMMKWRVLVVPGNGFGQPGHFRLSFCVPDEVCESALPAFEAVMKEYRQHGKFRE